MNELRDLNRLFDVLNQTSVEFVKTLAEQCQRRFEKTERIISEGRLAVDYKKFKKKTLAELLIDEGMGERYYRLDMSFEPD